MNCHGLAPESTSLDSSEWNVNQPKGLRQFPRSRSVRRRRQRRGAALVELAIVLVLSITIALGCIDLGRFASTLIAVNNAAREGASFGSTHPYTDSTQDRWLQMVRTTVADELEGLPNYNPDSIVVPPPVTKADAVDFRITVRVKVEVTHEFETIVPWPVIPRSVQITRSAQMPVIR